MCCRWTRLLLLSLLKSKNNYCYVKSFKTTFNVTNLVYQRYTILMYIKKRMHKSHERYDTCILFLKRKKGNRVCKKKKYHKVFIWIILKFWLSQQNILDDDDVNKFDTFDGPTENLSKVMLVNESVRGGKGDASKNDINLLEQVGFSVPDKPVVKSIPLWYQVLLNMLIRIIHIIILSVGPGQRNRKWKPVENNL